MKILFHTTNRWIIILHICGEGYQSFWRHNGVEMEEKRSHEESKKAIICTTPPFWASHNPHTRWNNAVIGLNRRLTKLCRECCFRSTYCQLRSAHLLLQSNSLLCITWKFFEHLTHQQSAELFTVAKKKKMQGTTYSLLTTQLIFALFSAIRGKYIEQVLKIRFSKRLAFYCKHLL